MTKPIESISSEFEQIILLITNTRSRISSKANAELVMLYFSVGQIVAEKVANGKWGDGTVNDLANYILEKQPFLKGFNRRGLYRMKQFYEVYSDEKFASTLLTQMQNKENTNVSPLVTPLNSSSLAFCKKILSKISWTHHLLILSKSKSIEEKLFYLNQCLSEKLSKREPVACLNCRL